jgi:N-methylhydantoinase A
MEFGYQVDVRYHGQGLRLTIDIDLQAPRAEGLRRSREPFDAEHTRLFTFALPLEHEFVALRAVVQGKGVNIKRQVIAKGCVGRGRSSAARRRTWTAGLRRDGLRPRSCKAGNRLAGPAIVMEMDSTSVILPKHHGKVDAYGNILIYPTITSAPKSRTSGGAKSEAGPRVKRRGKKPCARRVTPARRNRRNRFRRTPCPPRSFSATRSR